MAVSDMDETTISGSAPVVWWLSGEERISAGMRGRQGIPPGILQWIYGEKWIRQERHTLCLPWTNGGCRPGPTCVLPSESRLALLW